MSPRSIAWKVSIPFLIASLAGSASAQATTLEGLDAQGRWPTANGSFAGTAPWDLTPDGRYVVFESAADSLVAGDTNGDIDVFLRDRNTGAVERVSVGEGGVEGNSISWGGSVSADGRFVSFRSASFNLVPNDTNASFDIFVRDRQEGSTVRASVSSLGDEAAGGSDEGRISPDGRFVVFSCWAGNLVPGDGNLRSDVFIRDLQSGTTERVSVDSSGVEGNLESYYPDVTPDGRFVSFFSVANNLHAGDANGTWDVFVRDRQAGVTELASVSLGGSPGNGPSQWASISADGRFIAFESAATDLVPGDTNGDADIFVRDRMLGTTERASVNTAEQQAFDLSNRPEITPDGRFVAFSSPAVNLSQPDTNGLSDVFVRDRLLGTTTNISISASGASGSGGSFDAKLSADGRFVLFRSYSSNLVLLDVTPVGFLDVYLRDTASTTAPMAQYCTAKLNSAGCTPRIGANGAPSATGTDSFFVVAAHVVPQKSGIFFWSAAPASIPFGGGFLCVQSPTARTPVQNSGGSTPCAGVFTFHFAQSYMADHGLAAGDVLYGQYWSRDPGFVPPNNISLTDGIQITIGL